MQDYLNKVEPGKLRLFTGGLILLIATALFTYVVWPQMKTYRGVVKTRTLLESAVTNRSELNNQLATEKAEVEALNKRLHGDMANLPARQMETYIIGRLQKISWQHRVELAGVRPSTGEIIKTFQEILFDVNVAGDYLDLYAWLRELRKELGFVVIKQYEMRPIEQNKESPRLMVKLTMATYRSMQQ